MIPELNIQLYASRHVKGTNQLTELHVDVLNENIMELIHSALALQCIMQDVVGKASPSGTSLSMEGRDIMCIGSFLSCTTQCMHHNTHV